MESTQDKRDTHTPQPGAAPPPRLGRRREDLFESEEVQLLDYLRVLKRNKWLIAGTLAVALAIAGLYILLATPLYRAELTLQVQPRTAQVAPVENVEAPAYRNKFYETQLDIIQSRSVAHSVINKLSASQVERIASLAVWHQWLPSWPKDSAADTGQHPQRESPVAALRNGLNVFSREDSEIVSITYDAKDPELAAKIANHVAQAYIELDRRSRLAMVNDAHTWLTDQLDKLRERLNASEEELHAYQSKQKLLASENLRAVNSEKLAGVTRNLTEASAERIDAKVRYEQIQAVQKKGGGYQALIPVIDNPVVQELRLQQVKLSRQIDELSTHYGTQSPKVVSAKADRRGITQLVKTEVDNAVQGIKKDYQAALTRERRLEQVDQRIKSKLRSLNAKEFKLSKLEREVAANKDLFEKFRTRIKETSLTGELGATDIRIIDKAETPEAPYSPSEKRSLGLALLFGSFGGLGLAFLRENVDRSFKSPRDIEKRLKTRALGIVPYVKSRHRKALQHYVASYAESPFAHAMGTLRTSLQTREGDQAGHVLLVTSSTRGEGKTTLSANLAIVFGQLGRTLLVDADLRNQRANAPPTASRGLTDFAQDGIKLDQCVVQDEQLNQLYHMSPGTPPDDPLTFLNSEALTKILTALRQHFQTIILDSPPLLAVSDAIVLGYHSDQTVLVVKANATTDTEARDGIQRLQASNIPLTGAVLSQVDLDKLSEYTGYVHYGYYGRRAGAKVGRR